MLATETPVLSGSCDSHRSVRSWPPERVLQCSPRHLLRQSLNNIACSFACDEKLVNSRRPSVLAGTRQHVTKHSKISSCVLNINPVRVRIVGVLASKSASSRRRYRVISTVLNVPVPATTEVLKALDPDPISLAMSYDQVPAYPCKTYCRNGRSGTFDSWCSFSRCR